MRRRDLALAFWLVLCLSLGILFSMYVWPGPYESQAQLDRPGCHSALESDGQWVFTCQGPRGFVLRHPNDIEGGVLRFNPDGSVDKTKLNINISGGDHINRGYVVLSPDTGKGTIMEDGHLRKLLIVRGRQYGGTEARTLVTFKRGLKVCDRQGCWRVKRP